MFDVQHLIDVGALQAEHAAHAGLRGNAGELRLHALEQRAGGFGAPVEQGQTVARRGLRMQQQRGGLRVGQDVFARLVEELEAECDMLAVDVMHLRDVSDVGRAGGIAGGQQRWHGTLQAGPDAVEAGAHQALPMRAPAPARAVCAKMSLTVKLTATKSCTARAKASG